MNRAIRRAVLGIFAAILGSFLLVNPATANHHVREFVAPYIPGTDRSAYGNAFIVVTNQQPVSAPISINAYVNQSGTAQSCGTLTDLAPYEIRRFARNGGTLCVARDESADSSLRIRTIEGVHVSGYLVLAADRNRMLIPMEIASVDPVPVLDTSMVTLTRRGNLGGIWIVVFGSVDSPNAGTWNLLRTHVRVNRRRVG